MKVTNKSSNFLLIYVITLCILFIISPTTVKAFHSTNNPTPRGETISDVFKKPMPEGLTTTKELFLLGRINNSSNGAYFANASNGSVPIVISTDSATTSATTFGSVWSNIDNNNYIDLNYKQTMSMWLYFGNRKEYAGDGMAFVLQNDSRGIGAYAQNDSGPIGGQTLGVWGAANSNSNISAKNAIQNSWALEFDTFFNNEYANTPEAQNSKFDSSLSYLIGSKNHIAYNYPGSASTYGTGRVLNHLGVLDISKSFGQEAYLSDGTWHHVSVSWNPVDRRITYKYNDRNLDGSPTEDFIQETTAPINTDIFQFNNNYPKLRWGFTGSTGKQSENNIVIFESIPSLIEGEAEAKIIDITQDKVITAGSTVNGHDDLKVVYNLHYSSGKEDWSRITASMNLPSHIDYTKGLITYANGSSETFDLSGLSNYQVQQKLSEDLTKDNPTATIVFDGRVQESSSEIQVAKSTSLFESEDLIVHATTDAFTVKVPKELSIKSNINSVLELKNNEDADLSGTIQYKSGLAIDNQALTLHTDFNNTGFTTESVANNSQDAGIYKIHIPNSNSTTDPHLHEGVNTMTVFVSDADGNHSNAIIYTINVHGILEIKTNNDVSFKTSFGIYPSQIIERNPNWDVQVIDNRLSGATWHLQASADKLSSDGVEFNGDIVFVSPDGKAHSITGRSVTIASGQKNSDTSQTTDITNAWNNSTGILLKTTNTNASGKYSGQITWDIVDSLS